MKVLVLGGTGAMGNYLVRMLSSDNVTTIVTSRISRSSSGNINYIKGDAHDIDFIQTILMEHWDVIIDFMIYTTVAFEARVSRLLDATSHYIFLSSARVYSDSKYPIKETSTRLLDISQDEEFLLTDEYSLIKARQENVLKNEKRTNWTIIRPYITYSDYRLQLGTLEKEEWLYRALHGRTIVFSSDVSSKVTTLTYGFDVAKGIMSLIFNSKPLGEIFNITGDDSFTWERILNIYLKLLKEHLGVKPNVIFHDIENFTKYSSVTYQLLYDRLYNRKFDNSKIKQYVNKGDFTEIEQGLKICMNNFLKDPKFKEIGWRAEALRDRQTKEYTPIKEICGLKNKFKYLIFRYLLKF